MGKLGSFGKDLLDSILDSSYVLPVTAAVFILILGVLRSLVRVCPSDHILVVTGGTETGLRMLLRMAEITLLEAYASQQVVAEVERNLLAKLPKALPAMHMILARCLKIVPDPQPEELIPYAAH